MYSWIYLIAVSHTMNLFVKDRLDDGVDPNGVAVNWDIRMNLTVTLEITKDNDGTASKIATSNGTLTDDAWNYIAVSLDVSSHVNT